MRICFALPCRGRFPLGGLRIVYEHANRLAQRGHHVTLMHTASVDPAVLPTGARLKAYLRYWQEWLGSRYRPDAWFALDQSIKTTWHLHLHPALFPDSDIVIATGWQTADVVAALEPQHGSKYYFIQHYETWDCPEDRLQATWKLPLKKIVIARWLAEIATEMGEDSEYAPNAIDLDFFKIKKPVIARDPKSILLQSHVQNWKGTQDALQALALLKKNGSDFKLTMFGHKQPGFEVSGLDYQYFHSPAQTELVDLYNSSAIFVAASWSEGWGLTPHEAAACGAALAVTDVGGHREFLKNGASALLSEPRDIQSLAENIHRLLSDNDLRIELAFCAHEAVQPFTWDRSSAAFQRALNLA